MGNAAVTKPLCCRAQLRDRNAELDILGANLAEAESEDFLRSDA